MSQTRSHLRCLEHWVEYEEVSEEAKGADLRWKRWCAWKQRKENMRNIQNIQNPLFGWSTVIRGDKGATKVNCTWKVEEWARSAKGTDSEGKREPWGVWNEVLIWTWYFMQPLWQLCLEKRWAAGRQGRGLLQVGGGSYGEGERAPAVETLSSFEPNS